MTKTMPCINTQQFSEKTLSKGQQPQGLNRKVALKEMYLPMNLQYIPKPLQDASFRTTEQLMI